MLRFSYMGKLLAKRVLDVFMASLLLILALPIIVITSFAIAIESSGPVIFEQERIGKDKKVFKFFKLRSMFTGSDERIHKQYIKELLSTAAGDIKKDSLYKLTDDKRITRVGRFIRRTSIDELPQLYNVLKGDMSMVGPRPAIPYELGYYDQHMMKRFSVKPGITGLWQTSARYRVGYKEMVELDVLYASTWNILMDIRILFKTVKVVLDVTHTY